MRSEVDILAGICTGSVPERIPDLVVRKVRRCGAGDSMEFPVGPTAQERRWGSDGNVAGLLDCAGTVGIGHGQGDGVIPLSSVRVEGILER